MIPRAAPAVFLVAAGLVVASQVLAADPVHGRAVFAAQCGGCHTATPDGRAFVGPDLFGVVGRRAGSTPGYAYSPAMKAAGFDWTDERLETYLAAPAQVVPGTKMMFMGVKSPTALADLVAYLDSLK